MDLGTYRNLLAEEVDLFGAVDDPPSRCADCGIANENNAGLCSREIVGQVMANAPPVAMPEPAMMMAPPLTWLMAMESALSRVKCRPGRLNGSWTCWKSSWT